MKRFAVPLVLVACGSTPGGHYGEWSIYKEKDQCYARAVQHCAVGESCNPPAPRLVACRDALPVTVYQDKPDGPCFVESSPPQPTACP